MLEIRKLVMLRAIVHEGSIAAAARQLGYTRSAVSQQLSALERACGTPLLVRSGRCATPTPEGARLVEHTERILVELRAAEAMLGRGPGAVSGVLRIGVPFREGPGVLSGALTQVRQRHPDLEVRLAAITDESGAEEVRRGRLDVVILSRYGSPGPGAADGLREWVLGHDPLRLCVSAEDPLAQAGECSIDDLREHPWVLCPTSALGRLTTALCVAAGYEPKVSALVNDMSTALDLVGIGWGVTIAPDLMPTTPRGVVRRVALTGVRTVRHRVLLVRDGEHLSPRVAAVVAAVRSSEAGVPGAPAVVPGAPSGAGHP